MLNVSTFAGMADIYVIIHLIPHPCQHVTGDLSHRGSDTVARIPEISRQWRHKYSILHNPPPKVRVKSGDRSHHINASSSYPVYTIHLCGNFWLRSPPPPTRLCGSEPDNCLVERRNQYCLHSTGASAIFLRVQVNNPSFIGLWIKLYEYLMCIWRVSPTMWHPSAASLFIWRLWWVTMHKYCYYYHFLQT